jgi:hypothetical protein
MHHFVCYGISLSGAQGKSAQLHHCCKSRSLHAMPKEQDPIIRKSVSVPESLWKRIDDYQFANRLKKESEAVRRLLELGLQAAEAAATDAPSPAKPAGRKPKV